MTSNLFIIQQNSMASQTCVVPTMKTYHTHRKIPSNTKRIQLILKIILGPWREPNISNRKTTDFKFSQKFF